MIEDYAFINIGSKRVIVQIKELRKNKQIMDLTKILKNAPIGIELYSLIHGSLTLHNIKEIGSDLRCREIICKDIYNKCVDFLYNGYYSKKYQDGSCILYPSSNNYCWNNWQTILFKKEKSIGHVINKIIDDSLPTDEERYIITPNLKCIDIYGKEHDLSDIDILNFEFSDKLNESLFFSQLNLNGYIYNNTEHKLITVDKNQCIHQISDGNIEEGTVIFIKYYGSKFVTYKPKFKIGDYIWAKAWKQMAACWQYKIIHITESGYEVKKLDHKGRLWKESQHITFDSSEFLEIIPKEHIRKFEHKFNIGDEIICLKDNKRYTVIDLDQEKGYTLNDISQGFHHIKISFKDEILYEKNGTETESIKEISLEDRQLISDAEDFYLKTENYKLHETLELEDLKNIEKDLKNKVVMNNIPGKDKFDYNNLYPYQKILVRDSDDWIWKLDFFSHMQLDEEYIFGCVGDDYRQCIPYTDDTKNLLGTKNKPNDYYITW